MKVDMNAYYQRPANKTMRLLGTYLLNEGGKRYDNIINIQKVKYGVKDHLFSVFENDYEGEFYNVDEIIERPVYKE